MTDMVNIVWFALAMAVVLGCGALLLKTGLETDRREDWFHAPPAEHQPVIRRLLAPEAVITILAAALSLTIVCLR